MSQKSLSKTKKPTLTKGIKNPPSIKGISIQGIGIDIVEIKRIAELSPGAIERILSPRESEYCYRFKKSAERIAGHFAAKEAISKALGTGFGSQLSFKDLEIHHNSLGAPSVVFSSRVLKKMPSLASQQCLITISHERNYAVAMAVIQ